MYIQSFLLFDHRSYAAISVVSVNSTAKNATNYLIMVIFSNQQLLWMDVLFFTFRIFCFNGFPLFFRQPYLKEDINWVSLCKTPHKAMSWKTQCINLNAFANESTVWECRIKKYQISRYDVINWIFEQFESFNLS